MLCLGYILIVPFKKLLHDISCVLKENEELHNTFLCCLAACHHGGEN
jgi:hypothetical protein